MRISHVSDHLHLWLLKAYEPVSIHWVYYADSASSSGAVSNAITWNKFVTCCRGCHTGELTIARTVLTMAPKTICGYPVTTVVSSHMIKSHDDINGKMKMEMIVSKKNKMDKNGRRRYSNSPRHNVKSGEDETSPKIHGLYSINEDKGHSDKRGKVACQLIEDYIMEKGLREDCVKEVVRAEDGAPGGETCADEIAPEEMVNSCQVPDEIALDERVNSCQAPDQMDGDNTDAVANIPAKMSPPGVVADGEVSDETGEEKYEDETLEKLKESAKYLAIIGHFLLESGYLTDEMENNLLSDSIKEEYLPEEADDVSCDVVDDEQDHDAEAGTGRHDNTVGEDSRAGVVYTATVPRISCAEQYRITLGPSISSQSTWRRANAGPDTDVPCHPVRRRPYGRQCGDAGPEDAGDSTQTPPGGQNHAGEGRNAGKRQKGNLPGGKGEGDREDDLLPRDRNNRSTLPPIDHRYFRKKARGVPPEGHSTLDEERLTALLGGLLRRYESTTEDPGGGRREDLAQLMLCVSHSLRSQLQPKYQCSSCNFVLKLFKHLGVCPERVISCSTCRVTLLELFQQHVITCIEAQDDDCILACSNLKSSVRAITSIANFADELVEQFLVSRVLEKIKQDVTRQFASTSTQALLDDNLKDPQVGPPGDFYSLPLEPRGAGSGTLPSVIEGFEDDHPVAANLQPVTQYRYSGAKGRPHSLPLLPPSTYPEEALNQHAVCYGTVRQLTRLANTCERNKEAFLFDQLATPSNQCRGVLLNRSLVIKDGTYDLQMTAPIGRGRFGEVHVAHDFNAQEENMSFAVKKLPLEKFSRDELTILAGVAHPGVVQCFGALYAGIHVYILLEFIQGRTLQEDIEEQGQLNSWIALEYLRQLLDVLCYLKVEGIIHEDIKADNLMLRAGTYNLVLIDFGLARKVTSPTWSVPAGESPSGGQTQWSPEKASSEEYDMRADLWAAMCVFIHAVSGSPPWIDRFGGMASLILVIACQSPPLQDVPEGLPEEMMDLIREGMTVTWQERPTVDQLLTSPAFKLLDKSIKDPIFIDHFYYDGSSSASSVVSGIHSQANGLDPETVSHRPALINHHDTTGSLEPESASHRPVAVERHDTTGSLEPEPASHRPASVERHATTDPLEPEPASHRPASVERHATTGSLDPEPVAGIPTVVDECMSMTSVMPTSRASIPTVVEEYEEPNIDIHQFPDNIPLLSVFHKKVLGIGEDPSEEEISSPDQSTPQNSPKLLEQPVFNDFTFHVGNDDDQESDSDSDDGFYTPHVQLTPLGTEPKLTLTPEDAVNPARMIPNPVKTEETPCMEGMKEDSVLDEADRLLLSLNEPRFGRWSPQPRSMTPVTSIPTPSKLVSMVADLRGNTHTVVGPPSLIYIPPPSPTLPQGSLLGKGVPSDPSSLLTASLHQNTQPLAYPTSRLPLPPPRLSQPRSLFPTQPPLGYTPQPPISLPYGRHLSVHPPDYRHALDMDRHHIPVSIPPVRPTDPPADNPVISRNDSLRKLAFSYSEGLNPVASPHSPDHSPPASNLTTPPDILTLSRPETPHYHDNRMLERLPRHESSSPPDEPIYIGPGYPSTDRRHNSSQSSAAGQDLYASWSSTGTGGINRPPSSVHSRSDAEQVENNLKLEMLRHLPDGPDSLTDSVQENDLKEGTYLESSPTLAQVNLQQTGYNGLCAHFYDEQARELAVFFLSISEVNHLTWKELVLMASHKIHTSVPIYSVYQLKNGTRTGLDLKALLPHQSHVNLEVVAMTTEDHSTWRIVNGNLEPPTCVTLT